jgi:hypothetical protein
MIAALAAILSALMIAGIGGWLRARWRMSRFDAVVATSVLAELAKKLLYIGFGTPAKAFSLVLGAPLILSATWWLSPSRLRPYPPAFRRAGAWLGVWWGAVALFTVLNPQGSVLGLTYNFVAWLWVVAAAGVLGYPGRWTYRVLWLAVIVGIVNQVWGTDPLWRAYGAIAEPVSIGARYTPETGYSGSIFSSQTEFGDFVLAASALLCDRGWPLTRLVPLSLMAAVLTGQRYSMLGITLFWLVFAFARAVRFRPWQAVAAVLAYSPLQDALGSWLLERQPLLAAADSVFFRRLSTLGTLSARVGFTEAWANILSRYWLAGIGIVDVWSPTAVYVDDRHNLVLHLLIQGGAAALIAYFAFAFVHFRQFRRAGERGRSGFAFLLAALLMGMGGPQPSSNWFFLGLGGLFYRAAAAREPAVPQSHATRPLVEPA